MRAARLARSARLRRVHALLLDWQPHSTLEIINQAQVCAVNSVIAELRQNGMQINCNRQGDVWYYQAVPHETVRAAI